MHRDTLQTGRYLTEKLSQSRMQKLAHVVVDAIMILWGAYIFLALVTFILFYGCVENGNGAAACKDNLLTEIVLFWQ